MNIDIKKWRNNMEERILNLYPLFKFFIAFLAIIGGYNCISNIMNLLSRFSKDVLDNKKDIQAKENDTEIIKELIERYPMVDKRFIVKSEKEQNIENNQEIHEINKKFEKLEELVEKVIENANRT